MSVYTSWHFHNREQEASRRVRTNVQNFNTWATGVLSIDDNELTLFMHSSELVRAVASNLASLSHDLFMAANEMDVVAQAKTQADLVG